MKNSSVLLGLTFLAFGAISASAQQATPVQANPTPGCTETQAQLEANKKVAEQFFLTNGDARVALADPSYKQHNPQFKKRAEDEKVTDYEEFKTTFGSQGRGGAGRGPAAG